MLAAQKVSWKYFYLHAHSSLYVRIYGDRVDINASCAANSASGACLAVAKCLFSFGSQTPLHIHCTTKHCLYVPDPSRMREGSGDETFQAKKRQKADSPVVTTITKFKFSGHVVLIFCILTVAIGQIQTCSPTYLNHIRSTVLKQRTHSQGFAAHTELIRTCSEQSDTHLLQLQYRYATANTPVSHHAGTRTVSQRNVFCCVRHYQRTLYIL